MQETILTASAAAAMHVVPLFVGVQDCASGHSYGPHVREYYLIHFCVKGKGILQNESGTHSVSAGQMFLIRPGEVTTYTADTDEPWSYHWLAFHCDDADFFANAPSVLAYPVDTADRLFHAVAQNEVESACYLSILYELFYRSFATCQPHLEQEKVLKIRAYIDYHYMQDLRVADLAHTFGFERSYLYRIFKECFNIGVKNYITKVRMEHARQFLHVGYGVAETARMVGYEDMFHFSRSFKNHFGVAPSQMKWMKERDEA